MNVPERLGKYLLVERIAVGGMAEIFKARAVGFGGFKKVLAIKRLHAKYCQDADFIKMLIDEAKIAVQLSHRNIGQIFDLDRIGDVYFICMEYVDGRDLNRLLRRLAEMKRDLPLDIACFVAREICSGLDYAHRKVAPDGTPLRIIHRDVSPQNILISWEGEVKIIDFGIAKAALRAYDTESGIIKGKFYYMSPEQARGVQIDHRSDVFSLGVVLYESLTGDLLYGGLDDDDEALLDRVRQAHVNPPSLLRPEIPPKLDQIVLRALAKNPRERYQSAAAFGDALSRYLQQAHPRTDMISLATFMRQTFEKAPIGSAPTLVDPHTIMSRLDYQMDISSLIFAEPAPETPHDSEEPPAPSQQPLHNPSPEDTPMASDDPFDQDPFFNDRDSGRRQRRSLDSDVYELQDQDLEIVEEPQAEQPETDDAIEEVTTVRHRVKFDPNIPEPQAPSPSYDDQLDDEPTRVYRPQAVLAATPDADRGPLHGEVRFEQEAMAAKPAVQEDEVTVITSLPEAPPEARTAIDPFSLSQRQGGAAGALAMQPSAAKSWFSAHSPITWIAALFVLVLLLGAALAVGVRMVMHKDIEATQIEPPAPVAAALVPESTAPERSSYYITSIPAGAEVTIDGVGAGTTPTTVPDLEVGQTYFLRIDQSGYYAHEQQLRPTLAGQQSIAFTLNPMLGVLQVETVPAGAAISVNGTFVQNSPVTIPGLDTQSHYLVAASMPGYLTAHQEVVWPVGPALEPVSIRLALQPLQVPPELLAEAVDHPSEPPRPIAVTTPSPPSEPAVEAVQQVASREQASSTQSTDQTTRTERSRTRSSTRTTEPERSSSQPSWRDRLQARARASEQAATSSGSAVTETSDDQRSTSSSPGTTASRETTATTEQQPEEQRTTDRPPRDPVVYDDEVPAETGHVSIQAIPPAQVFVDGRIVATETPLMNHELPIGNHRVKVYFIDLRQFSEERTIRIVEGETRRLVFRASE
ncbi:MAG: protein kinase [Bradymonadales bacterium]|nr:protein kinase [Bradymonadales bacterium]